VLSGVTGVLVDVKTGIELAAAQQRFVKGRWSASGRDAEPQNSELALGSESRNPLRAFDSCQDTPCFG